MRVLWGNLTLRAVDERKNMGGTTTSANPVHTVKTASERARRHPKTVLAALRTGELRGYQRSTKGTWRIFEDDLDAWVRGESARSRARR
jgi:hypothetical protein